MPRKYKRRFRLPDDDLATELTGLEYDFKAHTGRLHMAAACSCDMRGCIALFQRIDPEVQRIEAFAGGVPDIIYHIVDGDWRGDCQRHLLLASSGRRR